ncbi:GOLPH3/VPS74 family protein [Ornithinimicrobium panacihumi]|uniref:GOLPH3/VPS74 family protein n=1 Tax=Ornithinimicrobium panacihumi TaxID=2008449 RepID=UPI003F8BA7BD
MLIAEDILLLGTDERGRDLFQQYRQIVVGGAVLTELMLRGNLGLDGKGKIQVREAPAPTEPLLAQGLQELARRDGRRARFVIPQLGTGLLDTALAGLSREEILQPERMRLLGIPVGTSWELVMPAVRQQRQRQLAAVLLGMEQPTTSTGATIALLQAANVITRVFPSEMRPATSDKELRERARAVATGGWEPGDEAALVLEGARVTRHAWQGARRHAGRL